MTCGKLLLLPPSVILGIFFRDSLLRLSEAAPSRHQGQSRRVMALNPGPEPQKPQFTDPTLPPSRASEGIKAQGPRPDCHKAGQWLETSLKGRELVGQKEEYGKGHMKGITVQGLRVSVTCLTNCCSNRVLTSEAKHLLQ